MSHTVSVTQLWIYPVKSLPGVAVSRVTFDAAGPMDDRRWMLVDPDGRFVSQRGLPELALFRVEPSAAGFHITAPDGDVMCLPEDFEGGHARTVSVWKDSLSAREASVELSGWFSEKLKRPLHLVHVGTVSPRPISDSGALDNERVAFADGYPLLVSNQASLERLNRDAGMDLSHLRFRPNIVVAGAPADAELSLGSLAFEDGRVDLLKPCVRCNVPAIDLATARYDKSVAAALKAHSQWQGQTVFGVNGVARGLVGIDVGDRAQLVTRPSI